MLPASAFFGVAAYVTCSSMMLVANKVTLTLLLALDGVQHAVEPLGRW